MNIQEKAEQYALTKHNQSQCFDSEREQCIDDYAAGYNEAKRWIPVGERLPETFDENNDHNTVLCKMDNGMLFTGVYMEYQKKWNVFGFGVTCSIKEWREI